MKTVGLCMIFKDEVEDAVRVLKQYGPFFDKFFFTVTSKDKFKHFSELYSVFPELEIYVNYFEWTKDFSAARNFNFKHASTDYVFWIDADDDIKNPDRIRKLANDNQDVDKFSMMYYYAFDESGNCIMQHYRERLIKNEKNLVWKGRLHETMCPVEEVLLTEVRITDIAIVHRAKHEDNLKSLERNIDILTAEYKEHGKDTDPRTLSYLATALGSIGKHDEAIRFYQEHIKRSGWDNDIYISWTSIAQNLRSLFMKTKTKELLNTAISADLEAIAMAPEKPDAYLGLGEDYFHLKDWDKAIEWTEGGLTKKVPEDLPFYDPTRYSLRPIPILAYSYLNKGNVDKAFKLMSLAKKKAPNNAFIKDNFSFFEEVFAETEVFKAFVKVSKYLENNDKLKTQELIKAIPDKLAGDDRFIGLRNRYKSAEVWDKDSVVIFCGNTGVDWAPPSVVKGIGGSEEAVIYLAKELARNCRKVTVFNSCGDLEGTYDGVEYKNYWHFNPRDVFSTVISWRANIFSRDITAKKKIVWLHDVPFKNDWNEEAVNEVDKIIVLSEYHRTLLPQVPDEKIFVSTNGLNIKDLVKVDKKRVKRNPYRIIYGSSYDRGLEHLLDLWPQIKEEVPQAELHVFYGWDTYDQLRTDLGSKKWKAEMVEKLKQGGVVEHGRVGHKRLLEEFAKSGVWAYPTFFKEINCITGLKAQASGCIPVYHNHYALSDTVKYGYGIKHNENKAVMLNQFKRALVNALTNEHSFNDEMRETIRRDYSWEKIANDWDAGLLKEQDSGNNPPRALTERAG